MNYENLIGLRNTFLLGDKYRLDLSWQKAIYEQSGRCKLEGAKFSGPALSFAEAIKPNDHISIDFFKQYYIHVENVYIATLKWAEVKYNGDNTVLLEGCFLEHDTELNRVPNLNNDDMIIIDTKGHDRETHNFYLNYMAYVTNSDGQVYNFIDK